MWHDGIANRFSWNIIFNKFLSALLLTALVFGGTAAPASGIPPNPPGLPPTITVTTILDTYPLPPFPACIVGPGGVAPANLVQPISLREAICAANNAPGQIIGFNILPPGIQTISVGGLGLGALPNLFTQMTIDGTTQPGWAGQPLIFLDGTPTLPNAFNGLTIMAPGVNIYGLGIMKFGANGIEVSGVPNAVIQANYIGIGPTGVNPPQPNTLNGVLVSNGAGNTIGGPAMFQWNVISGNLGDGVRIWGLTSGGNMVQGNLIGTDFMGNFSVANGGAGVSIKDAPSNTIGGVNPGEGNLISGNTGGGIFIDGVTAASNLIQGNLIGTDIRGARDLGNTSIGIAINKSPSNTVGGPTNTARNVISGNNGVGISITSSTATGNQVYNNLIGTNITGTFAISNTGSGMYIDAPRNLIGAASMGNLISGNGGDGVFIDFTEAVGNQVLGNKIGTNLTGTAAIPNLLSGILISDAPTNTIGGPGAQDGNLISGNLYASIYIEGSSGIYGSYNNKLLGNRIGTDSSGNSALGNGYSGVQLENAPRNTIGGSAAGAGNLISGNGRDGVRIAGSGAHDNLVLGNKIGSNILGSGAIPNQYSGIFVTDAPTTTIGGTWAGEGNLVSGNLDKGIYLDGSQSADNMVLGNKIGTDYLGSADLGNGNFGVFISNSPRNTVGGSGLGAGNLISGNDSNGVMVSGGNATKNKILGNLIGTNMTGTLAIPNTNSGIFFDNVKGNTIGGAAADEGNLVSGNDGNGIYIGGAGAHDNKVFGNKVGTDLSGMAELENDQEGIYLNNAPTNTIGGVSAGMGNLISGNGEFGVYIYQSGAYGNVLYGNIIGMNATVTGTIPNANSGVRIRQASDNLVGGINPGEGNIIAGNTTEGVDIDVGGTGPTPLRNRISGNSIYSNGHLGIDLKDDEVTANDNLDADSGPNNLQNYPQILLVIVPNTSLYSLPHTTIAGELNSTVSTQFKIEFYSSPTCDPSGYGEGKVFLGVKSVTSDASGKVNFTFDTNYATTVGEFLTAIAIDPQGNSSEFSACRRIDAAVLYLPVIRK